MKWSDVGKLLGDVAPVVGGLLGGPAGAAVGGLVSKALGTDNTPDAVAAAIQDPANALKIVQLQANQELQLATLQQQLELAQAQTNTEEASSRSLFIGGWRPAVGWSCAAAFCYAFIVAPFSTWIATLTGHPVPLPTLDLSQMMPVLLGMLGLGGLRTYEKVRGVSTDH